VFAHVKERSDVLPVPYDDTVSQVQVELPFQRQTRKLSDAFWFDTLASKSTVSLLRLARSEGVIDA
jgi:hypothetical protein